MSLDQITPDALKLPPKERAQLALSLWESLEDSYDLTCERSDEEALGIALQRDDELASGAVQPVDHEEMMRRLRP
jgi:hypothetical protein